AHERPLVFADNDRPGIMLTASAHAYALRYGVAVGRKVFVATCGDFAYAVARDLRAVGVNVTALMDVRPEAECPDAEALRGLGIAVFTGHTILGTEGRTRIASVRI